jgi:hypothetical protein
MGAGVFFFPGAGNRAEGAVLNRGTRGLIEVSAVGAYLSV